MATTVSSRLWARSCGKLWQRAPAYFTDSREATCRFFTQACASPHQAKISEEEHLKFSESGWCVPSYRLPEALLHNLQSALERLIDKNPGVRPEDLVNAHLTGEEGNTQAKHVVGEEVFLRHGADPALTSIVESLLGSPNVFLWGCHIFCKPPNTGRRVPWHQDAPYWPIEPMRAVTIWVALDDSDAGNSCLMVRPGSHRDGELEHEVILDDGAALGAGVCCDLLSDLSPPVNVELCAGQVSAHDPMLVHGSNANSSSRRRAGITYLYMDAESHFNREGLKPASQGFGYESRPLFWVRGNAYNLTNTLVRDVRPSQMD